VPGADQTANVVLTADNRQYNRSMDESAKSTASLTTSVLALSSAMNTLAQRTGKKLQIVSAAGIAGLAAATASAAKFDQQMSTMQANAVLTGRKVDDMAKNVNALRGSFAVTTDQAIALQTQLSKLGQVRGIDQISASMLKLSAVTGESLSGLTAGMIGLQRQMGTLGGQYTEKFSSALAKVSASAGVSAQSVLDFSNAIAPVAKVAGISQKEVMGFSTAFVKAGQDGGAAATAFNKMLTDITRSIQYGSPELKAYSNLIGVSVSQFKQMPRSEAVIKIFDAINKQGPDAIKTLERFGLDGIRTYKALQGMASQGGIQSAMADVAKGYENTKPFNDAAKTAMDGLNDELQKLGNNLSMVGQAFGKAFVGPTKAVVSAINSVVKPIAALLQSMGSIPGVAALAGTAMVGVAGTIVRSLGLMTGMAAFRQLQGGTFNAGRRIARGDDRGWASRAADSYTSGEGGMFQRRLFEIGMSAGAAQNRFHDWRSARRSGGSGQGGPNPLSRLGALGVHGLGAFTRMQMEPVYWGNVRNPMNRSATFESKTFGDFFAAQKKTISDSFSGIKDALSGKNNAATAAAAKNAANGLNNVGRESARQAGFFKTLGKETLSLSVAMGKAAAGSMLMVGGGAARGLAKAAPGIAGLAGTALKGIGGAAMGFLGGPVGLALTAGAIGFSAYQSHKDNMSKDLAAADDADATQAAGGAYRVALGEAARATTTFADIVKRNASDMSPKEKPGVVSDAMAKEAAKPGHAYTDPRIGKMTEAEATTYAKSASLSDQGKILLGYDLTKRFGQKTAQQILNAQSSMSGALDTRDLFNNTLGDRSGFGPWRHSSDDARNASKLAAATGQANLADINSKYGSAAGAQYTIATLNGASRSRMRGGNTELILSSIAAQLGIDAKDKNVQRDFTNLFAPSIDNGVVSNATFKTALDRYKADPRMYSSALGQQIQALASTAGAGANYTSSVFNPTTSATVTRNPFDQVGDYSLKQLRYSQFGARVFGGDQTRVGLDVNEAIGNQGNANMQQIAMKELAASAMATSKGFSGAVSSLQDFKAAVGDVNDPLYQLAANAQAVVMQRQSEAMHYMSRGEQAGQLVGNFRAAQRNAAAHPDSPEAETELEQSRQQMEGAKAGAYDFFKQIVAQQREFEISTERAQTDFAIQRGRQEFEYNLSRKRAQEDFDKQRNRSQASFDRQIGRSQRDYNKQRGYALADFNKQRARSEEDYQHQVMLLQSQAARQLYDIYDRIQVKRSWDASNLLVNANDQLQQLQQQATNLTTARGMGVSSDVIKLLGLNETENAQQLARFIADLQSDPALVKAYNDMATARLKASKKIVTDKDNEQWSEMERSFKLNADRALTDFNQSMGRQAEAFATSLKDMRTENRIQVSQAEADFSQARQRQADDYARSVANMVTDFNRQMIRARDDLSRSAEEITGTFDDLVAKAIGSLTGTAAKQAQALYNQFKGTSKQVKDEAKTLATDVAHLFSQMGLKMGTTSGGVAMSSGGGANMGGGTTKYADGGHVQGWSPNKRADNINARLTAGEYVHNVDAVNYYGKGFMDALNKRQIPKGEMAFASGGLVPFGRWLQSKDYNVSEHPLFGGVHPVHAKNSWHYKAGAIDVNHDQSDEKNAINKVINVARQYGLRVIWQVADHFNHAHFDIGGGPDMIGPGVPRGVRNSSGQYNLLDQIAKLNGVRKWEKTRAAERLLAQTIPAGFLAKVISENADFGGSGDLSMPTPSRGTPARNAMLGRGMAAARGWTGPNWDALNWIYMHESGWNQYAKNPSSDAYGIPQALPGSKMASAGADWRTNAATQIKWGLGYIAERYGTPTKAQQFWKAHNWYGDGGLFSGGAQKVTGLGERGPEMVLPLNQRGVDYLLAVMKQYSAADARRAVGAARGVPAAASTYITNSHVDRSTKISGPITVQAQDPNEMLRKLEAKKRLDALTGARR